MNFNMRFRAKIDYLCKTQLECTIEACIVVMWNGACNRMLARSGRQRTLTGSVAVVVGVSGEQLSVYDAARSVIGAIARRHWVRVTNKICYYKSQTDRSGTEM